MERKNPFLCCHACLTYSASVSSTHKTSSNDQWDIQNICRTYKPQHAVQFDNSLATNNLLTGMFVWYALKSRGNFRRYSTFAATWYFSKQSKEFLLKQFDYFFKRKRFLLSSIPSVFTFRRVNFKTARICISTLDNFTIVYRIRLRVEYSHPFRSYWCS